MAHNKILAEETEIFVAEQLRKLNLNVGNMFSDDESSFYDLMVNDIHLEIKSCSLFARNGRVNKNRKKKRGFGAFDFHPKTQLQELKKHKAYVCFLVRHSASYILLGFIEAEHIPNNRRISLITIGNMDLISLEKFAEKLAGAV